MRWSPARTHQQTAARATIVSTVNSEGKSTKGSTSVMTSVSIDVGAIVSSKDTLASGDNSDLESLDAMALVDLERLAALLDLERLCVVAVLEGFR